MAMAWGKGAVSAATAAFGSEKAEAADVGTQAGGREQTDGGRETKEDGEKE
jgi:hypothetical protein